MYNTLNINLVYTLIPTSFTIVIYFFHMAKVNQIFRHLRRKMFKMMPISK